MICRCKTIKGCLVFVSGTKTCGRIDVYFLIQKFGIAVLNSASI